MMRQKPTLKTIAPAALLLSLALIFLLSACGPSEENTPAPEVNQGTLSYPSPEESGYPTTVIQSVDSAYPSESESEPSNINEAERFMIDLPLTAGSTTVSGQAPKNLAIAVVDITFGGTLLGTGVSDDDGRFTIPVSELPEGHRIGLTVTDITDGRTFEEVAVELYDYRGEGFINIPSVGVFFDSAMTQP